MLIPLSAVFVKTADLSAEQFWSVVSAPRAVASYKLTFGASLARRGDQHRVRPAARLGRWCATRSRASRIVDALVDLPFALPTAVAGISLTALYARNGWLGQIPGAARHQGRVRARSACSSR